VGEGDGISVDANDVVLRGFTIRNGVSDSIRLEADVTGTEIRNMRLVASGSYCIYGDSGTSAGPTTVRGNEFSACGSGCLHLSGAWDGVEVSKNKMMQCAGNGISIPGDNAIVENNRLTNVGGMGIVIAGNRAEVVGNRMNLASGYGVVLQGDDALIQSNRLDNIGAGGVYLDGDKGTVTRNRLASIGYASAIGFYGDGGEISRNTVKSSILDGIDVSCEDTNSECTADIVIERNKLTDVGSWWADGIYVSAEDGSGSVDIRRNNLRNIGYIGIDYEAEADSGAATIERNSVRTAGRAGLDCFDLEDDDLEGFVIDRNTARDCGGNGFSLAGTDHKLTNNKVKNTGDSGVDVDSSAVNVAITGNNISGAAKNGVEIESGASGTSVQGNKIKNNRLDICDEGTTSTIDDNSPSSRTKEIEFCADL
jgi:hypothetical protein